MLGTSVKELPHFYQECWSLLNLTWLNFLHFQNSFKNWLKILRLDCGKVFFCKAGDRSSYIVWRLLGFYSQLDIFKSLPKPSYWKCNTEIPFCLFQILLLTVFSKNLIHWIQAISYWELSSWVSFSKSVLIHRALGSLLLYQVERNLKNESF